MNQGWIKIHRKIMDNPTVCHDPDYLAVWMFILCNAAHEEHDTWFDGKRITLKPGQLVTGRKKVSEKWDISQSKVERILKCFESEQQIEQLKTPNGRLISVLNWASYQESEQPFGQRVDNDRTTSEQRVDTIQECKECKEGKKTASSSGQPYDQITEAWNSLPEPVPKVSRIVKGSTRETKLRKRLSDYGSGKVLEAIDNIRDSNFLCGGGAKGFVVTFDWFIGPENFQKVLEGNYNDKTRDPPEERDEAWEQTLRWLNAKASG